MKYTITCGVLTSLMLVNTGTSEIASWDAKVQPAIDACEAIAIARKKLGNQHNWYALSAELHGPANEDGTGGTWDIMLGCDNGKKKQVLVSRFKQLQVEIAPWHGSVGWSYSSSQLADLSLAKLGQEVKQVLAEYKIAASIQYDGSGFKVIHRLREYHVHLPTSDGEFSRSLDSVQGPSADGFAIETSIARIHEDLSPYWDTIIGSRRLENGQQLWLRLRVGNRVDESLRRKLVDLLFRA